MQIVNVYQVEENDRAKAVVVTSHVSLVVLAEQGDKGPCGMNGVSWKVWSMVVICRWGTVWAFAYKDWWAETGALVQSSMYLT